MSDAVNNPAGDLGSLKPAPGSISKTKRIGRGRGSGHGDTATRGHKGAQSRSGYKTKTGFEGGQMPLKRRIPKRGFHSYNKTKYNEFNIVDLVRVDGDIVSPETLRTARIVHGRGPIVLLGNGEIERAVKVSVHRISKSAEEKITKVGGTIEMLTLDPFDRKIKKGPAPKPKRSAKPKKP
jgi:large subunit ribosomal protein L15